jgi:hypothetical protein
MSLRSNGNIVYAKLREGIIQAKAVGTPSDAATRAILLTSVALMKKRIFELGRDANERSLGPYSEEYRNKVRKANNWGNTNITLELTGEMRREFVPSPQGGVWVVGFLRGNADETYSYKKEFTGKRKSKNNPTGRKGILRVNTTAPVSGDRAEALEKRFGPIFQLTKSEEQEVTKAFVFEISKRIGG